MTLTLLPIIILIDITVWNSKYLDYNITILRYDKTNKFQIILLTFS